MGISSVFLCLRSICLYDIPVILKAEGLPVQPWYSDRLSQVWLRALFCQTKSSHWCAEPA